MPERRSILITGGAGFIGANVADRSLAAGQQVTILDDLSRPGVDANLAWLRGRHGDAFDLRTGSVTDARACADGFIPQVELRALDSLESQTLDGCPQE